MLCPWPIGLPPFHGVASFPRSFLFERPTHLVFLPGRSTASTAETNRESPSKAKPPCRFPVFLFITPRAHGPTKPPRFPIELIKAMPEAAEIPQRNWLGTDQNGPRVLESAITTTDKRATERDGE